jgi:aspartokinase
MINESTYIDEGLEALREAEWVVSKIGGINACDFQGNYQRITAARAAGKKQVVVLSVPRNDDFNTTTHINRFVKLIKDGKHEEARTALEQIQSKLAGIITKNVEAEYHEPLLAVLARYLLQLQGYLETGLNEHFEKQGQDLLVRVNGTIKTITGWGEDLAEELYLAYFNAKQNASARLSIDRQEIYDHPDVLLDRYHNAITNIMNQDLLLTGGYEAHLGKTRGYSDPKAALITESLAHHGANVVLAVEKEQGILTADPKVISAARLVPRMSSKFAAEVFGLFGGEAGALHHLVIPTLNGSNAKIVVFNPARPELGTTCIYREAVMQPTTIVARKTVPAIRVYGPMSNEKGIAEKVMRALREHSLDQIYTAENELRVTLSATGGIEELSFDDQSIGAGYTHRIDPKEVVVCISTNDEIMRGNSVLKDNEVKVESSSFVGEVGQDPNVNVSSYVLPIKQQSTAAVQHLHNAFSHAA